MARSCGSPVEVGVDVRTDWMANGPGQRVALKLDNTKSFMFRRIGVAGTDVLRVQLPRTLVADLRRSDPWRFS